MHRPSVVIVAATLAAWLPARAAEESIPSPDGRIVVTVSDTGGLQYRVAMDGAPVLLTLAPPGGYAAELSPHPFPTTTTP